MIADSQSKDEFMVTIQMKTSMPPQQIFQVLNGRWAAQILKTSVQLDVFSKIGSAAQDAKSIATAIGTEPHATEVMLNALCSLGFLEKKNGKYQLNELSQTYLVEDSPLYIGGFVTHDHVAEYWKDLTEVVRTGNPAVTVNNQQHAEEFFPKLAAGIFPLSYSTAHNVVNELKLSDLPAGSRALDIAAGSGVWSIPLAQQNKNVHVDALDFPSVLKVTREFTEREGVASQYSYIEGGWRQCKIESDKYDVIYLGHILHSEGMEESAALLKECYRAMRPGGRIVIAEMIGNNEYSGPPSAQLFAVNMLVMTQKGCIFSEQELGDLLRKEGFKDVVRLRLQNWRDEDAPIMVATK
jgi:ubiquinone/menaquinone biosynthesis C-methylase UbiE